jgi:hypothetical protein
MVNYQIQSLSAYIQHGSILFFTFSGTSNFLMFQVADGLFGVKKFGNRWVIPTNLTVRLPA